MTAKDRQTLLDALPLAALLVGHDERISALNAPARVMLGESLAGQHYITALRQPDPQNACMILIQLGNVIVAEWVLQLLIRSKMFE